MGLNIKSLSSALILAAAALGLPTAASAEELTPSGVQLGYQTINNTFDRAFFKNDPEFFYNRSPQRQLQFLLGGGSGIRNAFPEHEINRDAELVHVLYKDVFIQQVANDPVIRTPDLPTPYQSSLLQSPAYNPTQTNSATEFRFENLPGK